LPMRKLQFIQLLMQRQISRKWRNNQMISNCPK
jgi:hypothetical protein